MNEEMKEEKQSNSSDIDQSITVGDISNSVAVAIGHRASAIGTQSGSGDLSAMAKAFAELYRALDQKPDTPTKQVATQAVKGLEEEAQKGEQADETKAKEWNILATMLPDIGEVAISTFVNPINGLSTVFQKIAQKAKESQ